MTNKPKKYQLEIDTGGEECDLYEPRFASYGSIIAEGDTLEECLETATIDACDQDGECISCEIEADKEWMQELITSKWRLKYEPNK